MHCGLAGATLHAVLALLLPVLLTVATPIALDRGRASRNQEREGSTKTKGEGQRSVSDASGGIAYVGSCYAANSLVKDTVKHAHAHRHTHGHRDEHEHEHTHRAGGAEGEGAGDCVQSWAQCAIVSTDHGGVLEHWLGAARGNGHGTNDEPLAVLHVDAHADINVPTGQPLASTAPHLPAVFTARKRVFRFVSPPYGFLLPRAQRGSCGGQCSCCRVAMLQRALRHDTLPPIFPAAQ